MSQPRFFIEAPLTPGEQLTLPESIAHHVARVLRLTVGAPVTLFNGEGGEYAAEVCDIDRKRVSVNIGSHNPTDRTARLPVHLGMAVIKKNAMDSVLAKATEMGVTHITPVITARCTVARKVIQNRRQHWQQILIAACEQCGLNRVPQLHESLDLETWLQSATAALRIIAVPGQSTVVPAYASPADVVLLIGPEGGFTDDELTAARHAGFKEMTLGNRIMRAETAPVALLTVIQRQWGDFEP